MTVTAGFLGMRGTGDWITNERPENWRQGILRRWPNGAAPLTAILSMMGSEKVDDPKFHWWTKVLPKQAADITGVYTDSALSVAYVSGAADGDTLFIKMAEADAKQFREGHQVLLRYSSDLTVDVNAKVTARALAGASSYLTVSLLEADDNSSSYDLSNANRIIVIGNINPEGGAMPDALAFDPVEWYNQTQIFRTPLEMSRTAMRTRLRTAQAREEAKRETLELHGIEMEKAFLFGVPSSKVGANGKIERTMLGLIPAIRGGYSGHGGDGGLISDFVTASAYAGDTWLQSGEHWLDTQLETIFRFGSENKLCFCGSGTLLAIQRLVKATGNYAITSQTAAYGMDVMEWMTPFGKIVLKSHPLFNYESTMRNTAVIFEPENIKYRFIDDTEFYSDDLMKNTGWTRRDGIKEEWLTECSLEYHHPVGWGYLTGFGSDNTAS